MKNIQKETFKDEALLYSHYEYDNVSIIFSVAKGYHIKQDGEHYRDVLQKADDEMYRNKEYLKAKYHIKSSR